MSTNTKDIQDKLNSKEDNNLERPSVLEERLDWRKVLGRISYKSVVNNVPFIVLLVILGGIYIANNNTAIETLRALDAERKKLGELKWRNLDAESKLMNAGMEAEIIRRGAQIGMKPLMMPAYKIQIKDSTKTVKEQQ